MARITEQHVIDAIESCLTSSSYRPLTPADSRHVTAGLSRMESRQLIEQTAFRQN
jgi:hypothetical protein